MQEASSNKLVYNWSRARISQHMTHFYPFLGLMLGVPNKT
jgi:hypothetical protein